MSPLDLTTRISHLVRGNRGIVWAVVFAAGTTLGLAWNQGADRRQAAAPVPEEPFFAWTRLDFSKEEYAERRLRLIRQLAATGGGIFLTPSRQGASDGFTFRQLDDFLYFTGLELPDSVLAIDADAGHATLFAPRRDARLENPSRRNDFPGRPLQADSQIKRESGIEDIRPFDEFERAVARWVGEKRHFRLRTGQPGSLARIEHGPFQDWEALEHFVAWLQSIRPTAQIENAYAEVARLRMVKSPAEIDAMRKSCRLGAQGIREAARAVGPGIDERSLEALVEAAYKRGGAQRLPFASIVKSGPNSLWPWRVLASHYDRRNRTLGPGDLVIFDVGCELDYYVSDVGRTFPASGTFSPEQKRVLEMEVAVADAMIGAIRPGVTLAELQKVADGHIPAGEQRYMQAGLYFGHHIGLSSGDPFLPNVALQPGMVVTVEPWYYNHDTGIAVFTEDDILVTADGAENLTADLPRTPEALEGLIRGR